MGSISPPDTHVVLIALPAFGHVRPVAALATNLAALGYTVTVITGTCFKERVEAIGGVEFVPLKGKADFDFEQPLSERFPDRPAENTVIFDMEKIFYDGFVDQLETVKEVIERQDLLRRRTVIVQDGCKLAALQVMVLAADMRTAFPGTMPIALRSPKVRHVPIIGIGHFPLGILSKDTAPFGLGLPSQGVETNMKMNEGAIEMFSGIAALERRLLEPYECAKALPTRFHFDNWVQLCDIYCQLCVPELELPRSDLPSNVRFVGTLTGHNGSSSKKPHPDWFEDFVLADKTDRPLIIVSSGSLPGLNVNHLILPTIEACKDLAVRLVVCAVHVELPGGIPLPDNVRWAQWIPFEDIFPHTSLVISSGGYGGVSQAFANGIPMILAGMTEDKQHNGMLGEATGAAINLKTQTPSVEQIKTAVLEVQSNATYKQRAQELKKSYAKSDPVKQFVDAIEEVSSKFFGDDGKQTVAGSADPRG